MTNEELVKWLKYSDSKSILVVNEHKELQELNCPFKVLVIANIGSLEKGEIVMVVEIKVNRQLIVIYIIDGNAFYYYHFEIISQ